MKNGRKVKVLQICGGLSTEGIGVFLLNTFEHIDDQKFKIDFALATKYPQTFERKIVDQGGRIFRTYEIGDGYKSKLKHGINLYKLLKKEKYDVVHSHMDFFNGFNLFFAYLANTRMRISHSHIANVKITSFQQKLYYKLMRIFIILFSTKKLGCSTEANQFLHNGGKLIINGIDLQKFSQHSIYFPEDIKVKLRKINLITVGRIDNQKNPFFTVDFIEAYSKLNDDFHFHWIGTGSLSQEIVEQIRKKKLVKFITLWGTRIDVQYILPKMDAFIFPSKYEGFGIVIGEAQACGVRAFVSENVPDEVKIGNCTTLSLFDGAEFWADKVSTYINNRKFQKTEINLDKINITKTVKILEKEYLEN